MSARASLHRGFGVDADDALGEERERLAERPWVVMEWWGWGVYFVMFCGGDGGGSCVVM